jgi:hypothetical protein
MPPARGTLPVFTPHGSTASTRRSRSAYGKATDALPALRQHVIVRKGTRRKKLEIVQLW